MRSTTSVRALLKLLDASVFRVAQMRNESLRCETPLRRNCFTVTIVYLDEKVHVIGSQSKKLEIKSFDSTELQCSSLR